MLLFVVVSETEKFICQVHVTNRRLTIKIKEWQTTRKGIGSSMLATFKANANMYHKTEKIRKKTKKHIKELKLT